MEHYFLLLLILLMMGTLLSGFPVGFALPGSAIMTISAAGLLGWAFTGDTSSYFAHGGPAEWLRVGVTNLRSLYWEVERDTLIAIPLFIFMGLMLQRSRIAEDLLVAMAQLFGPVPGGLGISVVLVGALLAATTGIVGATVIAMGLISLPAMLRNNYSKPLAAGTICASGTLGQIIPPSIVLIILADQLANAADIASTIRKAKYKEATGEFTMPSELDVVSASAGDMFMGAIIPGLILVVIYVLYIFIHALINPKSAPPVPYDGDYDRRFLLRVLLAMIPPLTLILVVLGSILAGVATVNQAGAIGAIGAIIMGGYRLYPNNRKTYLPAILAIVSLLEIFAVLAVYDINIKSINSAADLQGNILAGLGTLGLLIAIFWSLWRTYNAEDVLMGVMRETTKTTSMVFVILIGAAMLTSAFRAFGGEELVRDFLGNLPGGFWMQFVVVMGVIFLLGFFLDFIEIAVVVVPIVAPILLADPSANITAVWLGVMIGLNIQTSYLTPPFGFSLFYLRSVAPAVVKTMDIYRGAMVFVGLQLVGLAIAGFFPPLVNYLPNRIYLGSDLAPPPMNPRIQTCLERYVFAEYDETGDTIIRQINTVAALDYSHVPDDIRSDLDTAFKQALVTLDLVKDVRLAQSAIQDYLPAYQLLRREVRRMQANIARHDKEIGALKQNLFRVETDADKSDINTQIAVLEDKKTNIASQIPAEWKEARGKFVNLNNTLKKSHRSYRQNVDEAYQTVADLQVVIADVDALRQFGTVLDDLDAVIENQPADFVMPKIKEVEVAISKVAGSSSIKTQLSRARRILKKDSGNTGIALEHLSAARAFYQSEIDWRSQAAEHLLSGLAAYDAAIKDTIGIRLQSRLTKGQVSAISQCKSVHKDVSQKF